MANTRLNVVKLSAELAIWDRKIENVLGCRVIRKSGDSFEW